MATELRRYPRIRVQAPFACSFARLGLQQWAVAERSGLGVVLDVSLKGAKVMSQASMNPGDQLFHQSALAGPNWDDECRCDSAMGQSSHLWVRIYHCPPLAETRLRKFLSRAPVSQA